MIAFDKNELYRRVDEVLYYVWDPIGVAKEPFARGEYKGYVQEVLELVEQNDDVEPVSSHLADIVQDMMGLSPDKKQCDYTAELLLKHKQAVKQGLA
jgi:hypothetical protein